MNSKHKPEDVVTKSQEVSKNWLTNLDTTTHIPPPQQFSTIRNVVASLITPYPSPIEMLKEEMLILPERRVCEHCGLSFKRTYHLKRHLAFHIPISHDRVCRIQTENLKNHRVIMQEFLSANRAWL